MAKRPHIIIFNPDQMRADSLHHLGNEAAHTPNYDALAAEGVSFDNCFCQNPVCVPSRNSFMTGLYPHVNGHRTMSHLLHEGESNLFNEMKNGGYYVWSSGRGDILAGQYPKWYKRCIDECANVVGDFADDKAEPRGEKGSDTYFSFYQGVITTANSDGISHDNDWAYTEAAIDRIKHRPKDKPLFMFLALNNPHPPYKVEQKYLDMIDISKLPPRIPSLRGGEGKPSMEYGLENALGVADWSEERFDRLRAVYLGMVAKTDDLFGRLVAALKEEGIYDDCAIFVFSDHGDYTGDYGITEKAQNCFPDCLTNVPLLVKPPKGFGVKPGVDHSLVELLDIYSTVLEYAGIESDHDNFSRSLVSEAANGTGHHRDCVFCEGGRRHGEVQCTEGEGKKTIGISDMYNPRITLQESEGPEHTYAAMLRTKDYKYIRRLYEQDEFYDLSKGESRNLIDDPQYKEAILDMKDRLLTEFMSTCDIVPRELDQRFSADFYIAAAKAAGQPKIAVGVFAAYMKLLGKTFDETISDLTSFAKKFKSINK